MFIGFNKAVWTDLYTKNTVSSSNQSIYKSDQTNQQVMYGTPRSIYFGGKVLTYEVPGALSPIHFFL